MDDVHGFRRAAIGALFQGITDPHRDWVDRAVGPDANVAVVWTTCASGNCAQPRSVTDEKVVWENEFFSRSVRQFYYVHDPVPGGLPEQKATFHPRSGFYISSGHAIRAEYALTDRSVDPAGRLVAADTRKGISLYRLHGPLRQASVISGLYPDTWSGPRVTYLRRGCEGGTLTVALVSDGSLFTTTQTVVARSFGTVVGRVQVPASFAQPLVVPLRPHGGRCVVTFEVTPTKQPGGADTRRLGIHFKLLQYMQPPRRP
jgi:hypothetical protein